MKYIKHAKLGLIIFEPTHIHAHIVQRLGLAVADIESAGFVGTNKPADAYCFGESTGLGMSASIHDSVRLQTMLAVTKTMGRG